MRQEQRIEVEIFGERHTLRTEQPAEIRKVIANVNREFHELKRQNPTLSHSKAVSLVTVSFTKDLFNEREAVLTRIDEIMGLFEGDTVTNSSMKGDVSPSVREMAQ